MFCPFARCECRDDCMYNGHFFDEDDTTGNCILFDAVQTVRSFQAPDNQIDNRLQEILGKLNSIETNTGYDQTSSNSIKNLLDEINARLRNRN